MHHLSQKTSGYEKIRLGTCARNTMKSDGCFVVSLSMLAYRDPLEVNRLFTDHGGFVSGCLVDSKQAAKILGLRYEGRTNDKPSFICIAETKLYFTTYKSQHFFVFAPAGTVHPTQDLMLDPLDPPGNVEWRPVKYTVVSYRLFHEKTPEVDTEMQEAIDFCKRNDLIQTFNGQPKTGEELATVLHRFWKRFISK